MAGLAAAPALLFTLLGGVVAYTLKVGARERRRSRRRGEGCNNKEQALLCSASISILCSWRLFFASLARLGPPLFLTYGNLCAFHVLLQDAAERGRLSDDTYVTLRRGLGLGSGLHLALCIGRLFGTEISSRVGLHMFFPGALAVRGVHIGGNRRTPLLFLHRFWSL